MATVVTSSIGTGKDYATITLWLAACPANLVTADQVWKGECYNQEFNENVYIAGIATDSTRYVWLTAAAGNRHNGKKGTGARIKGNSGYYYPLSIWMAYVVVEWLEVSYPNGYEVVLLASVLSTISHCIISGGRPGANFMGIADNNPGGSYYITLYRNIFYPDGSTGVYGLWVNDTFGTDFFYGNTVYGCADGIQIVASSGAVWRNNVSLGNTRNWNVSGAAPTGSNNCGAGGDTIPGTSPVTSTAANEFSNIGAGTEDLRLKAGAACINSGYDLGTNFPAGAAWDKVHIGIQGNIAPAGAWDIGADEYAPPAPGGDFKHNERGIMRGHLRGVIA